MSTPAPWLGILNLPVASVPMKFPATTLPGAVGPLKWMLMPAWALPERRLPAPGVRPPIVLPPLSSTTPLEPFWSAAFPAAVVPM